MRGHTPEPDERLRPIFSRSADGRLRAGSAPVAPVPYVPDEPEPAVRREPPVLKIPPKPQPVPAPQPHILRPQHPLQQPTVRQNHPVATGQPAAAPELADVGDMWSEQERIRLQEKWEEEQRKTERRQRRKALLRKTVTGIPSTTDPKQTGGATAHKPATQPATTAPKEITLNISMPSIPKVAIPKIRIPALPRVSKKRGVLFGGIAAVIIVGAVGYNIYKGQQDKQAASSGGDTGVNIEHLDPAKQTGKPDYETILPAGKSIEDFGGWVRVSPKDKNPVYAYADRINNVLINVSEQPLPATFKADTGTAMDNLAASYSANDKITAGLVTAYIGTSAKGPQSVLFAKGDLLVLIKSASKISESDWIAYIRTLQ